MFNVDSMIIINRVIVMCEFLLIYLFVCVVRLG